MYKLKIIIKKVKSSKCVLYSVIIKFLVDYIVCKKLFCVLNILKQCFVEFKAITKNNFQLMPSWI